MMNDLTKLAQTIGQLLKQNNLKLVTAESCTGGQVAEVITRVAGSSAWFERGFVTYSNLAKQEMLQVPPEIIANYGAVSEQTARAMAEGALVHSHGDISLAITGIAGPDGGSLDKPVGTVWFAWAHKNAKTCTELHLLQGNRTTIRSHAVAIALQGIRKQLIY